MNKSTMSLAVATAIAALAMPWNAQGATVDELSAQLEVMQAHMNLRARGTRTLIE